MSKKIIEIIISDDSDGLVGPQGWGEYDARSSIAELRQQIADEVARVYSADVSVGSETRLGTKIYVNGEEDHKEVESIRLIISEVWERWEWLVE